MTPCEHERLVVEAVARGRATTEVEAHLAVCATCREVDEMARVMTTLAVETERSANRRRLPEAGQLWWKGQLARRWEAEARAVAPLDRMQRFEVWAGAIAALILLTAFVRTLGAVAPSDPSGFWTTWAGLAAGSSLLWVTAGVVVTVTASAVAFRRLLED